MGTQPNRSLAKRGPRIRSRKLRNDLKDLVNAGKFNDASSKIENAVLTSGGASYLAGILAAGVIAFASTKETPSKSLEAIAGDSVVKLPKEIDKSLTFAGKDSIRLALDNTLIKRWK